MPSIRESHLNKIRTELDKTFFTADSFSIDINKDISPGKSFVVVRFIDKKSYYFEVSLTKDAATNKIDNTYVIKQAPGNELLSEYSYTVPSFRLLLDAIAKWVNSVKEDYIVFNILDREIEELRTEFNKRLEDHFEDDESHFTKKERENLYSMLDNFRQRIETLEKEQSITTAELEVMQKVIDDLKLASHSMKKKSWWRTAGNKILVAGGAIFASEAGQKLLGGVIDKYLP